jgi:DNA (cytosine-5)-methyltransferase 1
LSSKRKVIDLFAGVGGLSYGFAHSDSFEIVAANEILSPMARAYSINHPGVAVYNIDIAEFGSQQLRDDLGLEPGEIDIVVGGPPCQAYSTVGKRLINDPRGKLFQEYFRILQEIRPKLFIFENVKGLLSMQGGELLATIIDLFRSLGYQVEYKLLNAADFGAPQIRERVIIVGTLEPEKFAYPAPTHASPDSPLIEAGLAPHITIGEAIGDLPLIRTGEEATYYASDPQNEYQSLMRAGAPALLEDHSAPNNSSHLVRIMEILPEGGGPEDLPPELKPRSGFKNTYSRLWWDRPSTTVTRNLSTPSSSRCIHPLAPRPLTTREGARLQGFPDNYKFFGTRSDRNLQIGNAVPVPLSEALAGAVEEYFSRTGG